MTNHLHLLYRVTGDEMMLFMGNGKLPFNQLLQHGEATPAASYAAQNSDGHDVEVFVTAMPARFYRIEVAPRGDKPGYAISTGSGCADLVAKMAAAIADGMIGFEPKDQAK